MAITYLVQEPYAKSVKLLRSALAGEGLSVTLEMDVAETLRGALGVSLARCRLLYVTCPYLLLEAVVTDAASITMLPVHLVVVEHAQWTKAHLLNPARLDPDLAGALAPKVRELILRLGRCLERMGARQAHAGAAG